MIFILITVLKRGGGVARLNIWNNCHNVSKATRGGKPKINSKNRINWCIDSSPTQDLPPPNVLCLFPPSIELAFRFSIYLPQLKFMPLTCSLKTNFALVVLDITYLTPGLNGVSNLLAIRVDFREQTL